MRESIMPLLMLAGFLGSTRAQEISVRDRGLDAAILDAPDLGFGVVLVTTPQ